MSVAKIDSKRIFAASLACFTLVPFLWTTLPVGACDTPVYRYAMYRWEPAPYQVYYFHEKPLDEKATTIKEMVDAVEQSEEKPGNLIFISVDLKKDTELKTVPPYVKEDWLALKERKIPSYMVVAPPPYFMKLFSGDLDETVIKALIESPARGKIAKQLEQGKAAVMVMLTGTDKKANDEAEKVTKSLIKDIASGEVQLYLPPTAFVPYDESEEDGESEEKGPGIEFGFVKVTRDDPKEHWLVEFLLSMEEDLKDAEWVDKPMIFAVFGRGRALPPFVGKGINRDNLLDCVDFVTGACSCTVKDQNPGVDLLFTYDWYTAAENLATQFGAEEGNEYGFGTEDFFPDLMIPTEEKADEGDTESKPSEDKEEPASKKEDAAEQKETEKDKEATEEKDAGKDEDAGGDKDAGQAEDAEKKEAKQSDTPAEKASDDAAASDAAKQETTEKPGEEQVAEAIQSEQTVTTTSLTKPDIPVGVADASHDTALNENADSAPGSTAMTGVFAVGTGVGVGLVLLFALTFLVLRPR